MRLMTADLKRRLREEAVDRWAAAGREPSVSTLLEDPVVHLLLQSDGLNAKDVRRSAAAARAALLARRGGPPWGMVEQPGER